MQNIVSEKLLKTVFLPILASMPPTILGAPAFVDFITMMEIKFNKIKADIYKAQWGQNLLAIVF